MLEVFKDPRKYICGPQSYNSTICSYYEKKQKHFVIIGAGMAGLTSARLLLYAGHKVGVRDLFMTTSLLYLFDLFRSQYWSQTRE